MSHDAWSQDIIRLPRLFRFLQKPLAKFISEVRAPKSKEGYASIGGGSPLRQITDAQVYCDLFWSNSELSIDMTAIHWILAIWIFRLPRIGEDTSG
jgi:hypothetical protein